MVSYPMSLSIEHDGYVFWAFFHLFYRELIRAQLPYSAIDGRAGPLSRFPTSFAKMLPPSALNGRCCASYVQLSVNGVGYLVDIISHYA